MREASTGVPLQRLDHDMRAAFHAAGVHQHMAAWMRRRVAACGRAPSQR
jgi:hypothetical protein